LADDWPQWLGPRRDGVWRESGIVDRFPEGGPPVRWRVPVGGGFSGPAVAGGRVYLMDRLPPEPGQPSGGAAKSGSIAGRERVLCLDAADGRVVWAHSYDCPYTLSYAAGPRVTPTVADGQVFTLGAEGRLLCLAATNGAVVWSRELTRDYSTKTPTWGFAGHPLVDGDRVICLVGGPGSVAVAFERGTGRELWRALSAKEPGYSPPTLIEFGGKRLLIMWHPEAVNGLDPETGRVLWSERFSSRTGLSIATPRLWGNLLFVTAFYDGSLALRLAPDGSGVTPLYRSAKASERDTDMLHAIMCTPFLDGGYIYGVCSYGQLRCLKAGTGERVWETFRATTAGEPVRWANAFLTPQGGRYFLFNEKGDLILARLTPAGYEELGRTHLLDPTNTEPGRPVVWSHPAYANRCGYARNDREAVCVGLGE
jgi:outer membrane protein assembly factor BamB